MMYLKFYDSDVGQVVQSPISEESACSARAHGATDALSETPWPDLPIRSRFRSQRDGVWNGEDFVEP